MPGISIHVVDVSRGLLCEGLEVAVFSLDAGGVEERVVQGRVGRDGLLASPALMTTFAKGRYRAVFRIGDYYRNARIDLPEVPFIDVVTFEFGIDDPQKHYHLPMKCTPWGYSCFRGG